METSRQFSPSAIQALIVAAEQAAEYFNDVFDETFVTNEDADAAAEMNGVLVALESAIEQTKSTEAFAYVTTLPFVSQDLMVSDGDLYFEVAVWRSVTNICEQREPGHDRCDTACGLYYGTSDMREGKWCPRHYYEMHFGEDHCYKLVDQTAEEFEAALAAKHAEERG